MEAMAEAKAREGKVGDQPMEEGQLANSEGIRQSEDEVRGPNFILQISKISTLFSPTNSIFSGTYFHFFSALVSIWLRFWDPRYPPKNSNSNFLYSPYFSRNQWPLTPNLPGTAQVPGPEPLENIPPELKPQLEVMEPLFLERPIWSIHSLMARVQESLPKLNRTSFKKYTRNCTIPRFVILWGFVEIFVFPLISYKMSFCLVKSS